ncbi:MAG TPA: Rieske 2Fe-2S domain-containing protein [Candidatus Polarisedimenticolaceae bacterium]|nr:Rieske 2Fe-2S domain-containing protein [Candidatus Polarisedimenticolaceae bacterium]
MSVAYRAVLWNRQKRIYDTVIAIGVVSYLVSFVGLGLAVRPQATVETLIIRASGTLGLLLLHIILSIGPLCRLDARFLPLLYNRRHLGVTMFLVAALHATFALFQFHALGDVHPLVSLLSSNTRFGSSSQFPFELLGLGALSILSLMAATSHDFWLRNLSAPVWKSLHMLVYLAYALLVLHVVLGVLQDETDPLLVGVLVFGFVWVVGLQVAAGFGERRADGELSAALADGYMPACSVDEIRIGRARVVCLGGERVAIFRYDDKISAVSNVCQHQNGPLGEGRIVDGCITCPWHGYQYLPDSGASPPPFNEKIPTFNVRVAGGRVLVDPRPNPPGTRVEPARVGGGARGG